jgi:hypothetical protein
VSNRRPTDHCYAAQLRRRMHGTHVHFFIPNDWVSLVQGLVLDLGHSGEIMFVKRGELLVIKRRLDMTDQGVLTPRKRSMSPRGAMFDSIAHRTLIHRCVIHFSSPSLRMNVITGRSWSYSSCHLRLFPIYV